MYLDSWHRLAETDPQGVSIASLRALGGCSWGSHQLTQLPFTDTPNLHMSPGCTQTSTPSTTPGQSQIYLAPQPSRSSGPAASLPPRCAGRLGAALPHYCDFISKDFLIYQISLCFWLSDFIPCGQENILCIISTLFNGLGLVLWPRPGMFSVHLRRMCLHCRLEVS